jgi:hypothetical protein
MTLTDLSSALAEYFKFAAPFYMELDEAIQCSVDAEGVLRNSKISQRYRAYIHFQVGSSHHGGSDSIGIGANADTVQDLHDKLKLRAAELAEQAGVTG